MNPTQRDQREKIALEDAIALLGEEKRAVLAPTPEEYRKWQSGQGSEAIIWENPIFGRLILGSTFELFNPKTGLSSLHSRIHLGGQVESVPLTMKLELATGVTALHFKAGQKLDVTNVPVPTLDVPVQWISQEDKGFLPHTRATGQDNVDLVLMREDGLFMDLQCSVSTRKSNFHIAVHEFFQGKVVRTTKSNASRLPLTPFAIDGGTTALIVPGRPEDAFPEADYLKTMTKMGPQVVEHALRTGQSSRLSEFMKAEWAPSEIELPEELVNKGWQWGHTRFFNLVVGTGFLNCFDYAKCFVPFSALEDGKGNKLAAMGEFPLLEPMLPTMFKWEPAPRDKKWQNRVATMVRPCPDVAARLEFQPVLPAEGS